MATVLDHVQNSLPRSSVYDFAQSTDIFVSQRFAEVYPDTNASDYSFATDKKITFMLSSPQKTQMCDLRSHYLKFILTTTDANGDDTGHNGIAEPISNIINQVVIRCGDTVVEDIRHYNNLNSCMQRILLGRAQKKSNWQSGWDLGEGDPESDTHAMNCLRAQAGGIGGQQYTLKLNMSGVMNAEVLQSMYYMPLMIDLYLEDPRKCGVSYSDGAQALTNYKISNVRICATILEVNPLYTKSFEEALLGSDGQRGIRFPIETFYNYYSDISGDKSYFIKVPKRFVRTIFSAPVVKAYELDGVRDAFKIQAGHETNKKGIIGIEIL